MAFSSFGSLHHNIGRQPYTKQNFSSTPVTYTNATKTYFDTSYTIFTFNQSGTIQFANDVSIGYVIVGGGGSGSSSILNQGNGGGGGGGVNFSTIANTKTKLNNNTLYTIQVGSGGALIPLNGNSNGNVGSKSYIKHSVITDLYANGGLGGIKNTGTKSGVITTDTTTVTTTSGNGGQGGGTSAGSDGYTVSNEINSATYGGGGGGSNNNTNSVGGLGGLGGGGNGGTKNATATGGTANTGGGGGAGNAQMVSGAGGSGKVIIYVNGVI